MAKQDVRVDLFYDGDWQPQPGAVYTRDEIQIIRPRSERQTEPVTSTASLTFGNGTETNPYNPNNPSSTLYGKIGLNTPLRIVLGDEVTEGFEDASLDLTITGTWARSNADAHGGTWSLKSGTITHSQISEAVITVPAGATSMSMWYRTSSEEGFDFFAVYIADRLVLFDSGEGDWTHAMLDVAGQTEVRLQYQKDASDSSFDDAVYVDDIVFNDIRFAGEVSNWQPRRAVKGDAWTLVTANGVLQRLELGAKPLRSAHTRAVLNSPTRPLAHWPLEDSDRATEAASTVTGVGPMRPVTVVRYTTGDGTPIPPGGVPAFGAGVGPGGSDKLVDLTGGGTLYGLVPRGPNVDEWSVEFVARWGPDVGTFTESALMLKAEGTYTFFEFNFIETQVRVFHGAAFPTNDGRAVANFVVGDGTAHHFRYTVTQSGGNYDANLYIDGAHVATADNFGSAMAGTVGRVTQVDLNPLESSGPGLPSAIGQVTVWGTETPSIDTVEPAFGYLAETAAARLARLAEEEEIEFTLVGSAGDTELMGPQPIDTFTAIAAECERTDGGLLSETRYQVGLTYRTRADLYNQTAALVLDYDAGHIAPPLEPDIGNTNTRNDITVSSRTGATARAVQDSGPRNVSRPQDDPQGVGRYEGQVDVNPHTDAVLPAHATWHLGIGTTPDTRYQVTAELTAAPALALDASAVRIGDLVTIDNLPEDPDQAAQLALGYEEVIGSHTRRITFTGAPAAPYRVFVLGTSRLAASGSTLANNESTTGTAWEPTTPAGSALWSTDEEPYDLAAAGERVTVTAMTGASSPQAATVTRSVNGVVKAQTAGTSVQIFQPHVLAL